MSRRLATILAPAALCGLFTSGVANAQSSLTQRGFVDTRAVVYPEQADNDPDRLVIHLLAREEIDWRPRPWLKLGAAADARLDTNNSVRRAWRLDFGDRLAQRPALSIRRLAATMTRRGFSIDAGKQFIRWGRADLLVPTDRFAPRDFLDVTDNDFLAVTGIRSVYERGTHTLDAVWVPRMTPSRIPLLNRRWAVLPEEARSFSISDRGAVYPTDNQYGLRYAFVGSALEYAVALYDGVNHLPFLVVTQGSQPLALDVTRRFIPVRMAGGDAAVPLQWLTLKGEIAYFRTSDLSGDDYVQYVVQAERQIGEWALVGGYAGEAVTRNRTRVLDFAPDRGLTRTFLGRAGYTIDVNRSVAVEAAVRQNGAGSYIRGEFSRAAGQHWRTTVLGTLIHGKASDFLGQYRRNSHMSLSVRYSF